MQATYPNPASLSRDLSSGKQVNIVYDLSRPEEIALQIYDIRGRMITTLYDGLQRPGQYTLQWNGQTPDGTPVASGTYFVRMQAGSFQQVIRVSLIR